MNTVIIVGLSGVTLWLLMGLVSAVIAQSRGASGCRYFLVGFLLGPFGILEAVTTGRKCPECAKRISSEARSCPYCRTKLDDSALTPFAERSIATGWRSDFEALSSADRANLPTFVILGGIYLGLGAIVLLTILVNK